MKLREIVKIFFDFLSLCFINTLVILIFLIDNRIHIQFLVPKPMPLIDGMTLCRI